MMDQAQVVQQKGQLLIRTMKRERYTKSSASFKVIPSNGRNESVKGITDQIPLCKWVGQNSSHIRKLYEILILFSFQTINLQYIYLYIKVKCFVNKLLKGLLT